MKKLIMCLLVAGTFTTAAIAQDSTKSVSTNTDKTNKDRTGKTNQLKDYVVMKDGKMVQVNQSGTTALTKDLTLSNGTVVNVDGTVKSSDGTLLKLKDGEAVDMEGKLITKKDMDKKETAPVQ
jgi:hypothetical protein